MSRLPRSLHVLQEVCFGKACQRAPSCSGGTYPFVLNCSRCLLSSKVWKGDYFHRATLAEEGVRYQVGHSAGGPCPLSRRAHKNFMVFHTNGIHCVNLNYGGCFNAAPDRQQVMEVGWMPSTPLEPQTCATVACLRLFHTVNLQGRVSPYDFYNSLEHITNPFGFLDLPVSFSKKASLSNALLIVHQTPEPSVRLHASCKGVAAHQDDEEGRARSRSFRDCGNIEGGIGDSLPCLSTAWNQSSCRMGAGSSRSKVSRLTKNYHKHTLITFVDGSMC